MENLSSFVMAPPSMPVKPAPVNLPSKDDVVSLLKTNDRAVERALVVLFENQTADEQTGSTTKHANGRGFNATDAKFGTDLAQKVLRGWKLTPAQLACARKMVHKYAGQLVLAAMKKSMK